MTQHLPYCLLTPVKTDKLPKQKCKIVTNLTKTFEAYDILSLLKPGLLAVDIETNGTNAANKETVIVGLGLAQKSIAIYFDFKTCSPQVKQYIFSYLSSSDFMMVGHNIFFDSAFLTRDSGKFWNWTYCTYGLFRQLATEGFNNQKWSLKTAQVELLGWESTNETELDNWLIDNNHTGDVKKEHKPGYYPRFINGEQRFVKPDKSKMFNAPADILGYYCCLDASSTFDLLIDVLLPAVINLGPGKDNFVNYHSMFITTVRLHVYQQLSGILVDKDNLIKHRDWLTEEISKAESAFLNHPDIKAGIAEYNRLAVDKLRTNPPTKYKKLPILGKTPNQFKKDGSVSQTYLKWLAKREQIAKGPELTKTYLNWAVKIELAEEQNHFNINSGQQRQWLFYDYLKFPVLIKSDNGNPAVDKRALLGWGEPGQLLKHSNDLVKELGYVNGCLDTIIDNVLHPQFRLPGTVTGRIAGSGGVNLQQVPKSRGYLSCYISRPGYVWIDYDFTALEQVVLAELSKDPTLFKLYGPDAPASQDVYLFNGYYLPGLGKDIKAAGYNPDCPTPETIAKAKKEAKSARAVSKTVTLGSSYGMGPGKLAMTLRLQGIACSDIEAREIYQAYWKLYQGVKLYERYLLDEHRRRGGYVLNGIGRPIGVSNDLIKDIVNRVVQSTGHDLLIYYISILDKLLRDANIKANGIAWDWHDEVILEVREQDAEEVYQLFGKAFTILNERLEPTIPLKGDGQIVRSLAEAKLEG